MGGREWRKKGLRVTWGKMNKEASERRKHKGKANDRKEKAQEHGTKERLGMASYGLWGEARESRDGTGGSRCGVRLGPRGRETRRGC